MSVLENLRKGTDSTSSRIFIGLIVAVFIFWGAGNSGRNDTSVYATVNGQTITDSDFRRAYIQQARRAGRNLTEDEERDLRTSVLTSLIQEEAIVQEAGRLGVAVSEEEVARIIVKNESFAGKDGKFDERTYQRLLKANNLTRGQFEAQIHRSLLAQKLADLASHSVAVGKDEVRESWEREETMIDLTFVRMPVVAFLDSVVVSDADRDAFATEKPDRIKARYDEAYERFYNLPRRYQLRTVLLRTDIPGTDAATVRARADAVRAEAAAGADFESLARRWSEDLSASNGGQLGLLAKDQVEATVSAAADAAGEGGISEVVETSRGFQIFAVEKILDAKTTSLEEATPELATAILREERAPAAISAFASKLVEAWNAGGSPPADMLAEHHLNVDTTGPFSLGAAEIPRLGESPELRQQIESAASGYVIPVPLEIKDTLFVVAVGSRQDPLDSDFEASSGMMEGRLLAQRKAQFLEEWRSDVVSKAKIDRLAN